MKRLLSTPSAMEAHVAVQWLAESGIEATVSDEHAATVLGSPVSVWVIHDEDLPKARELMQELLAELDQEDPAAAGTLRAERSPAPAGVTGIPWAGLMIVTGLVLLLWSWLEG